MKTQRRLRTCLGVLATLAVVALGTGGFPVWTGGNSLIPSAHSGEAKTASGRQNGSAQFQVAVVNMIPKDQSDETNQDSEPNLAVNPADPLQIAASAFTPDPLGGPSAPIYVSTDGGQTWVLNSIVPSQDSTTGTGDITLRFGGNNKLYVGILKLPSDVTRLNILRTEDFKSPNLMVVLVDRSGQGVDQPYVAAAMVNDGPDKGQDRVFVGNNDFNAAQSRTATLDRSLNAATEPAPGGFETIRVETRAANMDGPQIRTTVHSDGTIYSVFYGWRSFQEVSPVRGEAKADVVVVRDDNWGKGPNPFQALKGPDKLSGLLVVKDRKVPWVNDQADKSFGQERLGGDLSIAVDPRDSAKVYLAWADRTDANDYTLHVRRSADKGQSWSGTDLQTVPNAKNPALAVTGSGKVGFLYQKLLGVGSAQRWETHMEIRGDDFALIKDLVLADVPAQTPEADFLPYIGDYVHLMAVDKDFYGIFSANNTPDPANFPNKVRYQRNANFDSKKLLDTDGVSEVKPSIDPFFFKVTGTDS
jgi:hypothetical protein